MANKTKPELEKELKVSKDQGKKDAAELKQLKADLKKAQTAPKKGSAKDVSAGPTINDKGASKTYVSKFPKQILHVPTGLQRDQKTNAEPMYDVKFDMHLYSTENLKVQQGIEAHSLFGGRIDLMTDASPELRAMAGTGGPKYSKGDTTTANSPAEQKVPVTETAPTE